MQKLSGNSLYIASFLFSVDAIGMFLFQCSNYILSFKDFMQMRSTVDFIMNSVNPKPNCLENFVIPCLLYFIVLVEMITKTHLKKHVESKTICVD